MGAIVPRKVARQAEQSGWRILAFWELPGWIAAIDYSELRKQRMKRQAVCLILNSVSSFALIPRASELWRPDWYEKAHAPVIAF
jgi:hypothetical protein